MVVRDTVAMNILTGVSAVIEHSVFIDEGGFGFKLHSEI
jgi:hypothetical protein